MVLAAGYGWFTGLTKDTSGVLLLAKTIEAARSLTEAFQKHRLEKTYLALVMGLPPESGNICDPILKLGGKAGEKMQVHDEMGNRRKPCIVGLIMLAGKWR